MQLVMETLPVCSLLLFLLLASSAAFPADKAYTRNEELEFEGRVQEPSHLLEMEHRGEPAKFREVMDKMFSSRTASAVDNLASSVVKLAGGVVVDLGDFVVDTIDQLPATIRVVSDAVGKAVDSKREKVMELVKDAPLQEPMIVAQEASDRISTAVQQSELQASLKKLEDSFASLLGKFIGVTYKNADNISTAFSHGIKRLTNPEKKVESEDDLPILSRSLKDNEIYDAKKIE